MTAIRRTMVDRSAFRCCCCCCSVGFKKVTSYSRRRFCPTRNELMLSLLPPPSMRRRLLSSLRESFTEPVAVAAETAVGGRFIRFSSRTGRTWNSLKMALVPLLLLSSTLANLAMALCEILSIMLVACCCCCCCG
jgi:hypothetical protein